MPTDLLKGTTGLAFKFKGGSVIVSDRRASMGSFVARKKCIK
jgi:20S proteasome alpha/beta subunit